MKQFILSCVLSVAAIAPSQAQQTTRQLPVYLDQTKPVEQRIDDAISRMTLAEKIRIIHAQSKFSSAGVPRLGFPDFWTDDGPHGVRPDVLWDEWEQAGQTNDSCVAFPALTCLAASWNPRQGHDSGSWRQHLPHAAQRPQLRVYGRRSVPGKHHGSAVYSGIAV